MIYSGDQVISWFIVGLLPGGLGWIESGALKNPNPFHKGDPNHQQLTII